MRVIAYYQRQSPNFYRRIAGIFSVLTHRGYSAFYQFAQNAQQIKVSTYDVVILSDWMGLPGRDLLPEIPGQYIYDLSDMTYYQHPPMRQIIDQCHGVFVPSQAMRQSFAPHQRVLVQPSAVPTEELLRIRVEKPERPLVALLTPFDWTGMLPALRQFVRQFDVQILTDDAALLAELPPKKTLYIERLDMQSYIAAVRSCYLVLCPGTIPLADPAIQLEFGLAGVPALVSPLYAEGLPEEGAAVCRSESDWLAALTEYTQNDRKRSLLAADAQRRSRKFAATRAADRWWSATAKFCAVAA